MNNEIERKFLIKTLPDLSGRDKIEYERYYLFNQSGIELRIQRKGSGFEIERKVLISDLERTREKIGITEVEFNALKPLADAAIIREGYVLSENPQVSLKIYHGTYEGLVRAEVEFDSVEKLKQFQPLDWFGKEITATPLARDAELSKLTAKEFKALLESL